MIIQTSAQGTQRGGGVPNSRSGAPSPAAGVQTREFRRVKAKQESTIEWPAPVRTSEIVPATGIWQSECSREGCRALFPKHLHEGAPAPCCPRCCNHTTWVIQYTLVAPAVAAPQEPAPPAPIGVPTSALIPKEKPAVETPAPAEPTLFEKLGGKGGRKKV